MPNGLETPAAPPPEEGAFSDEREITSEAFSEDSLIDALVRRGRRSSIFRISKDDEEALVNKIIRDFEDAEAGMSEFKTLRTEWTESWRGDVIEKDFPFEGSANIRVPTTSSFVEQMKARLYQALVGGDRLSVFSSLDPSVTREHIQQANDWFEYELKEVIDIQEFIQRMVHDITVSGISLCVPRYAIEERRIETDQKFPIEDGISLMDQMMNAIQMIFNEAIEIGPKAVGPGIFDVTHRDRSGDEFEAHIEFSLDEDILIAVVEDQEVIFDGVRLDSVDLEDLVIVNSAVKLEDLPFFGSRMFVSVNSFEKGVKSGLFRKLSKEDVESIVSASREKQGDYISQKTTESSDVEEGTQSKDISGVDFDRRWIELYRWEGIFAPRRYLEAVNDSSTEKRNASEGVEIAAWVNPITRKLVRVARLDEINPGAERTPIKFDFIVQPDRFFSWSLVGWLRHIQTSMDMVVNQRLDAGLMSNVPFFFYEPTAGMSHTTLQLEPGKGYPCKSVAGVLFPKINWTGTWSFAEEKNLYSHALAQAGLGPSDVGSFISKRTSASEFLETSGAADLRTKFIVTQLARSLQKLFYRILGLYKRNMKRGRVYQVTGLSGETLVNSISREVILKPFRIRLTANINQISSQLERETAINMMSLLLNQILIQMGIVKPDTIYAAIEKIVKASGYTGVPLHTPDVPQESDPPEVEHKQMISGEKVKGPTMNENFNVHIQAHLGILMDPNLPAYMPDPTARQALAQHLQASIKMQQTVQFMRTQMAAQGAQMQSSMNAMGIRPGLEGGQQAGDQAAAAEPAEIQTEE